MCLLKRDNKENSCNHEDCKSYYVKNKQSCLKTGSEDQEKQNLLDLLHKRIKKDGNTQDKDPQAMLLDQVQSNPIFGLNPMILAQMMTNPMKPDFMMPNLAGMFFPTMHGQPHLSQSIQELANSALGMPNMNLAGMGLSQMLKMRTQNNMTESAANNTVKIEANDSDDQTDASVTKDFQNKLFNLVATQNKILTELKEKHNVLEDAMKTLTTEISTLKHNVTSIVPTSPSNPALYTKLIGNTSENINTDTLLTFLYGPNPEFPYQLVLKKNLELPLYRERNFKFTVLLVDRKGNLVENTNRITLCLGIYSSENPPKFIESNTAGNKILKGFIEKDLVYGSASFEKIQIREVTSHFRNGWIFFVVYPKTNSGGNMITVNGNANFIGCQKIKPLVLEKVIVKAKKAKEKDGNAEADENGGDDADQEKEDKSTSNS